MSAAEKFTPLSSSPEEFADVRSLADRQGTLLGGLTPVPEQAAWLAFIGAGIATSLVDRCEDAVGVFSKIERWSLLHEGVPIQVFRQRLCDASTGDDFLYVHFADDPLSFGFLICALTGGGFMRGNRLG